MRTICASAAAIGAATERGPGKPRGHSASTERDDTSHAHGCGECHITSATASVLTERLRLPANADRRSARTDCYQFQTDMSSGGYCSQTSVVFAATPLLLKNSFAQFGHIHASCSKNASVAVFSEYCRLPA